MAVMRSANYKSFCWSWSYFNGLSTARRLKGKEQQLEATDKNGCVVTTRLLDQIPINIMLFAVFSLFLCYQKICLKLYY